MATPIGSDIETVSDIASTALIQQIADAVARLSADMAAMKAEMKADMTVMKADMTVMKADMAVMNTRIGAVETRIGAVETRIGAVETRIGAVETRIGAADYAVRPSNAAMAAASAAPSGTSLAVSLHDMLHRRQKGTLPAPTKDGISCEAMGLGVYRTGLPLQLSAPHELGILRKRLQPLQFARLEDVLGSIVNVAISESDLQTALTTHLATQDIDARTQVSYATTPTPAADFPVMRADMILLSRASPKLSATVELKIAEASANQLITYCARALSEDVFEGSTSQTDGKRMFVDSPPTRLEMLVFPTGSVVVVGEWIGSVVMSLTGERLDMFATDVAAQINKLLIKYNPKPTPTKAMFSLRDLTCREHVAADKIHVFTGPVERQGVTKELWGKLITLMWKEAAAGDRSVSAVSSAMPDGDGSPALRSSTSSPAAAVATLPAPAPHRAKDLRVLTSSPRGSDAVDAAGDVSPSMTAASSGPSRRSPRIAGNSPKTGDERLLDRGRVFQQRCLRLHAAYTKLKSIISSGGDDVPAMVQRDAQVWYGQFSVLLVTPFIKGEPLSDEQYESYLSTIAHAVVWLAKRGLVHVDVRADNVMRHRDSERITLVDYDDCVLVSDGVHTFADYELAWQYRRDDAMPGKWRAAVQSAFDDATRAAAASAAPGV